MGRNRISKGAWDVEQDNVSVHDIYVYVLRKLTSGFYILRAIRTTDFE